VQEDSRTEAWGLALSRSDDRSTEVFVCYSLLERSLCVTALCAPFRAALAYTITY